VQDRDCRHSRAAPFIEDTTDCHGAAILDFLSNDGDEMPPGVAVMAELASPIDGDDTDGNDRGCRIVYDEFHVTQNAPKKVIDESRRGSTNKIAAEEHQRSARHSAWSTQFMLIDSAMVISRFLRQDDHSQEARFRKFDLERLTMHVSLLKNWLYKFIL